MDSGVNNPRFWQGATVGLAIGMALWILQDFTGGNSTFWRLPLAALLVAAAFAGLATGRRAHAAKRAA